MTCPVCGGLVLGDGVRTPLVCERVEDGYEDREPDAQPLFCKSEEHESQRPCPIPAS